MSNSFIEPTEPAKTETYYLTGYCQCQKCCGKYAQNRPNGVVYGAGGVELTAGLSIASDLPFGTVVRITGSNGYDGEYISQDKTARWVSKKYDGKIIDIYCETHEQALAVGNRQIQVEIIEMEGIK